MTLKQLYLTAYRAIGLAALFLITGALVFYTITFGFFLFNNTWMAPVVLSPSDQKVLAAHAEIIRQRQFYDEATILVTTRKQELVLLDVRQQQLEFLIAQLESAIGAEVKVARKSISDIDRLTSQKSANIAEIDRTLVEVQALIDTNERELAAKLITKDEYSARAISFAQLKAAATTAKVEAKALLDQRDVLSRGANTLSNQIGSSAVAIDTIAKKLQAQNDLEAVKIQLTTKKSEIAAAENELGRLNVANEIINKTAYARVIDEGKAVVLGFVPYTNRYLGKNDVDVYSCYFIFIACTKVGRVTMQYEDEQIIEFPIFNTRFTRTVKGVFVRLELDVKDASRDQILFIGGKPLFL